MLSYQWDTSQTTIEKKAKERVVKENTIVYVEAVEIPPLSLKGFVNTLNLKENQLVERLSPSLFQRNR